MYYREYQECFPNSEKDYLATGFLKKALVFCICFLKILFIYDREITRRQRDRQRGLEAGSLLSREPDAGLDPRILGS